MKTVICKVIAQTEAVYVQSKKTESGQTPKCYIRLKELGGDYEDEYQCAILGNMALSKFPIGKTVAASLRFATYEYNGAWYQDILVNEIVEIN